MGQGQRTIDTVIKLSGESEYRSKLKSCTSELKLLKSDLEATTSEFRNNANSMEALTAKGKILSDMYAKQQEKVGLLAGALESAKASRDAEAQQVADLKAQYSQAKSALAEYGEEVDKNSEEYQQAKAECDKLRDAVILHQNKLDSSTASVNKYSTQLNRAQIELDKLDDQISENKKYLAEAENAADGCATSIDRYGKRVKETAEAMDDAGDSAADFGDILGANLVADLAADALQELGEAVQEFVEGMPEAAAEVKASASQFEQTFGDMKDEAKASLQSISDDTHIATTRMQDSFTSLYAFSKTAGADSGDALDIASRAMVAAADSAAYYDRSIEDTTESLQSFLKGNYENDSALGISCTETTRNTKANELYATSFDKLSESQKIDVLLAMVEAGNAASGALGQAARESDSWANVTGELDESMRQLQATLGEPVLETLTPIIQGITGAINELVEKTAAQELSGNIQNFTEAMNDAEAATYKTRAELDSSSYIAQQYVERLRDLEESGLDNAEAQREYAATVELLNGLIPDLNLTIDEQTGLLDQDTDSILENIDAWKKRATGQALQKQLTAQIEAQADAQASLYQAEAKQLELAAQEEDILRRLEEARARAAAETEESAGAMNLLADAMSLGFYASGDLSVGYEELANKSLGVTDEVAALEKELSEVRSAQSDLDKEVETATGILEESEDQIKTTTDAYEQFADTAEDTADSVGDSAEDMAADVSDATDEIMQAYEDAKASARDSIDQQIGLFEKISEKCDMSTDQMIENLRSQREAFENYADNIQTAMERGIDIGLVQQLSDGSVESMQILAELVTASDDKIQELNAEFQGVAEAKGYLSEGMAAISEEFLAMLVEMGALTEQEAYEMGQQLVNGLIAGVESKKSAYTSATAGLANAGNDSYRAANKQHSPSRRYREAAQNDVDGLIVQYRESKPKLKKATAELADAGYYSMIKAKQAAIPSLTAAASTVVQAASDSRLFSLLQQLLEAVRAGQIISLDGNALVGATAGAYDTKFGQRKILADRGAI